jgi:hypothetical protein
LQFEVDDYDAGCEGEEAEGESVGVGWVDLDHAEQAVHREEDDHCFAGCHECPSEVEADIEATILLTLGVELGYGKESRGGEILGEDTQENNSQRSE